MSAVVNSLASSSLKVPHRIMLLIKQGGVYERKVGGFVGGYGFCF